MSYSQDKISKKECEPSKFINFTNHASFLWGREQIQAAEIYGEIVDCPFPAVSADCDEGEIRKLAINYTEKIIAMQPAAVLCQGEYSLAFAVAFLLIQKDIPVLVACSERCVEERKEGETTRRESTFRFVRFRELGMELRREGGGEGIVE